MNYSKNNGIGVAYGNVIWTDTSRKMTVLANYAVSNQVNKTILATQKPLLILERKTDTLYVASDTLFSGPLTRPTDTVSRHSNDGQTDSTGKAKDTLQTKNDSTELRYVMAYHHVRLFSDSLQGVADSLYYADIDSAFHFYRDPVLWTGNTQLIGDTIVMLTRDQQADRILLQQHAMIINKVGPETFNQIKGSNIIGYFGDGNELRWMDVNGNAESMYYAQDDAGAFVGGNRTTSAKIHLYFKDGKLDKVVFLKDVDGTFTPPTKIPKEDKELKGFRWEVNRRPKSKTELME
jgi:hypothetical protein